MGTALFVLQIVGALLLAGSQFVRAFSSLEGVSLSWFITMEIFNVINLCLSIKADREKPSRIARQVVCVYAMWTILFGANIVAILALDYRWDAIDTVTSLTVIIGLIGVVLVTRWQRTSLRDGVVQGWIAGVVKAIPQCLLAMKIATEGSAGIASLAILAGHLTIGGRALQLALSVQAVGWSRPLRGLALGEGLNWISWVAITATWLIQEL